MTNRLRTKVFGLVMAAGLATVPPACAGPPPPAAAGAQTGAESGDVIATVGDRAITLAELERAWQELDAASHRRMQQQLYDARRQALDHLVGDLLLEEAARARGVTTEDLLAAERQRRLRPVTGEEIAATFESLRARMPPEMTLEQARGPIREALESQREQEVRDGIIDELRRDAAVVVLLEPPRLALETRAAEPALGPPGAPVEIVEYTDYQ